MEFMEKVTKISKIVGKTATDTYKDIRFTSEVLFRSFALFDIGQKVYVGIEPHNILAIRD